MNIQNRAVLQTGRRRREGGSVLLIGMIFLVMLMVGAVSVMNSSVQDEKVSGNTKRSSNAFLAAEGGMHDALGQMDQAAWYDYKCNADGSLEVMVSGSYASAPTPFLTNDSYTGTSNYEVVYLDECTEEPSTGFITSLKFQSSGNAGHVQKSDRKAEREVVFAMAHGEASFPAIFLNDDGSCNFDPGSSNAYNVLGNGGPAISTSTAQCETDVEAAISGKEDQYSGGVINFNPAPNFHTPAGLEAFYNSLIPASGACADFGSYGEPDSCITGNLHLHRADEGSVSYHKNKGFESDPVSAKDIDDADGSMGSTGDERVYVVHGDFDSTGSIDGAGVLVITGDAHFGGTPDWEGIIVVLGGEVSIGGGGTSTTGFNGTMIISDVNYGSLPHPTGNSATPDELDDYKDYAGFYPQSTSGWSSGGSGDINWDAGGGGTATYRYDCNALKTSHEMLTSMGAVMADFEKPDCSGGSADGTFGNSFVTDWYENVGN